MVCDLCNKTISANELVVIPLQKMQQAVRNGFNPWKTPGLDMSSSSGLSSMFGLTPETVFVHWRQRLMTDTTDWGLCPSCAETFRRATGSAMNRSTVQTPSNITIHSPDYTADVKSDEEYARSIARRLHTETADPSVSQLDKTNSRTEDGALYTGSLTRFENLNMPEERRTESESRIEHEASLSEINSLIRELWSGDIEERLRAAQELGEKGDKSVIEPLSKALATYPSSMFNETVEKAIKKIKCKNPIIKQTDVCKNPNMESDKSTHAKILTREELRKQREKIIEEKKAKGTITMSQVNAHASSQLKDEHNYSALLEHTLKSTEASTDFAIKNFEQQVSSYPDTADKFFWLGAANILGASASKNPMYLDRAIYFLEEALRIDPSHKNAYAKLLGAYMSKKDDKGVRKTAMRWAKADPDLPQTARQWLTNEEAILAAPGRVEDIVSRGRELCNAGKFDEATELLEEASTTFEDKSEIKELLSSILSDRGAIRFTKLGQLESGFQDLLRATEFNPRNWVAFYNLCLAAKERGDSQLALESGKKALMLRPEELCYDKRVLSLFPIIDALNSQLRHTIVRETAKDSNGAIEIPLGAKFEYYKRFLNMTYVDIYKQEDRKAIIEKFRMPATSSQNNLLLENMSTTEFLIRAVYFGWAFSEGTHGLGDSEISDFLGLEPILCMLDYENDAARDFCLKLLDQSVTQKTLSAELTKIFLRLESISANTENNSVIMKLFESMWKHWPMLKELGQKETDAELLRPLVNSLGKVGDAGAAEFMFGLLKKENLASIWPEIQKALSNILSENKKCLSAFPHIACKRCAVGGVKVKHKVGIFKTHAFVLCPKCNMSSFLE